MTTKPSEAPPWDVAPAPVKVEHVMDASAMALASTYDSLLALAASNSPRSLQRTVGSSEAGADCERQIAYKLAGTTPTNYRDPLRTIVGSESHLSLAGLMGQLNNGGARWLIEQPVIFRDIPGTVDLFDRHLHTVIDWKTCLLKKLGMVKRDGPPRTYTTQLQIYAAGLRAMGEDPRRVALLYVPLDGELSDLWAWTAPVDESIAVDAAERLERIATTAAPALTPPTPSRLCPWCDHYRPNSTDLTVGCPGNSIKDKP
jgi:hypothetical protein